MFLNRKFLVLFLLLLTAAEVVPHPRYSLRYGDKCGSCHFNPSGGGMRNEDGFNFGRNILSMFTTYGKEIPVTPKLSSSVSFGFDYRTQFLYSSEKQKGDFQEMSGVIYLNAALADEIKVITRYDFVQSIWEGFAVADLFNRQAYIKAGSFIPDFGLRIDDHTAYSRGGDYGLLFSTGAIRGLPFNPFYSVTGLELGVRMGDILAATASVGKNKASTLFSSDPVFTGRVQLTPSAGKFNFLAGASFTAIKTKYLNPVSGDQDLLPTSIYGVFGGLGYDRFTLMGEYDYAADYLLRGSASKAFMLEADYMITAGLDAVVRYDNFIADNDASGNYYSHFIAGLEFFPVSFVELIPQFRINRHEPGGQSNSFVFQIHLFY